MMTPGMQGQVSPESMGKTAFSAVGGPSDAKPAPPRTTGNTAAQNRLKPCRGKQFRAMERLGIGKSKRKSRIKLGCEGFRGLDALNSTGGLASRRRARFFNCRRG